MTSGVLRLPTDPSAGICLTKSAALIGEPMGIPPDIALLRVPIAVVANDVMLPPAPAKAPWSLDTAGPIAPVSPVTPAEILPLNAPPTLARLFDTLPRIPVAPGMPAPSAPVTPLNACPT